MNNVCKLNQNITDKFKHLDDVQYQQEYDEHCRKMSIIDSYEEEIKEVLFLSSGCVDTSSHSYKEYGLGLSPDYTNLENIVDKIQALKSKRLGLKYLTYRCYGLWGFVGSTEEQEKYEIIFVCNQGYKEYRDYLIEKINKYSKEFYNKEYFLRAEGSFMDSYYTLVTKDETWIEWAKVQRGYGEIDFFGRKFNLDSDLFSQDVKTYSEDTCVFIPSHLNQIYKSSYKSNPYLGVDMEKGKYRARINLFNNQCRLGSYNTKEDAVKVYRNKRAEYIKVILDLHRHQLDDKTIKFIEDDIGEHNSI